MIHIVDVCSKLIHNFSAIPPENILGIALYRIFFGLFEKRTEYKEKIKTVFDEINIPLPPQFLNPICECPFLISNRDGFQGLESKITGLLIQSANVKE